MGAWDLAMEELSEMSEKTKVSEKSKDAESQEKRPEIVTTLVR